MFEIGRVCMKIAGRDANKYCVIVDKVDEAYVLVDGQVRRKKVNIKHLEPIDQTLDIKAEADHSVVVEAFSKLGIKISNKKSKKPTERPKKQKAVRAKPVKKAKKPKKEQKEDKAKPKDSKTEEVKPKETKASEVKKDQPKEAEESKN